MWSTDKVWFLERTRRTNPKEFERLRKEYFSVPAKSFSKKYKIPLSTIQDAFWPRPYRVRNKTARDTFFWYKEWSIVTLNIHPSKVVQKYWPWGMVKIPEKKEETPYYLNPDYWNK